MIVRWADDTDAHAIGELVRASLEEGSASADLEIQEVSTDPLELGADLLAGGGPLEFQLAQLVPGPARPRRTCSALEQRQGQIYADSPVVFP